MAYGTAALLAGARWGLPTWSTLAITLAPLVLLESVLRTLVRRQSRVFEQQLYAALQAGEPAALVPLYERQRLLRFAAPRFFMFGKLGLIYARQSLHALAAAAFREAVDDAPHAARYALALGLGNSLYELNRADEAERVYRSAIDEDHVNVQACANLARLILRRGGDRAEALAYLGRAVDAARGGPLRAELIQALLDGGEREEALEQYALLRQEAATEGEDRAAALERARAALVAAGIEATEGPAGVGGEAKAEVAGDETRAATDPDDGGT